MGKQHLRQSESIIDYFEIVFSEAVNSDDWNKSYLSGLQAATSIAERVRIKLGLEHAELREEPASQYISAVLTELYRYAESEASKSYGRYRWLWYLRRLPDGVFEGTLASTALYDRSLTEVLATRGAVPNHLNGLPSAEGTFPIDVTVIKRIAWICGFSLAVSGYQVDYRVVGKGGVLVFDRYLPGQSFPASRNQMDEILHKQIVEYDHRNEHNDFLTNTGIPIENYDPKLHPNEPVLFQLGKVVGKPPMMTPSDIEMSRTIAMRYHPSMLLVSDLVKLISNPAVTLSVKWNPELPLIISLLYLTKIIYSRSPISRSQLFLTGYILSEKDDLDQLYKDNYSELRKYQPLLNAFPEDLSEESFSERLLLMEGKPSPLLSGPIAFNVNKVRIGIDICNATRRLHNLLEFPSVHGQPANVRAHAFEEIVQQTIDRTAWAPPEIIKRLIGHHFKKDGKWIGEIDAFGCSDRILLLVSCKSVVYTADYDRGDFKVIRNVRTMLEDAVSRFNNLVAHFTRFPKGESEYDFTAYEKIACVVITPHAMYVTEPLLSQVSLPGLKSYSSFDEFQKWLNVT